MIDEREKNSIIDECYTKMYTFLSTLFYEKLFVNDNIPQKEKQEMFEAALKRFHDRFFEI